MLSLRTLVIMIVTGSFSVVGGAQTSVNHSAHPPAAASAAGMPMPMAGMDEQMKTMQAMHEKMLQAKTPEQKNALMAEHMKVMQDSMAMMGAMGTGAMMGKAGMGSMKEKPAAAGDKAGMQGKGAMEGDMVMHHQTMEKRMQMMHAMMQMMMDRMPPAPAKP